MRVTNAPASRKRRTRVIRAAKGFRMRRSKLYRYASDALDHGRQYAFRDRKAKKRNFRGLWQVRINTAVRSAGLTYSRFMEGLKAAKVALDRKILADLAATDNAALSELINVARSALQAKGVKF
jgi:large subunit ribosomal protein L20